MKNTLLLVLLIGTCIQPALGQDAPTPLNVAAPVGALTLGGIPQLIADKLKEMKPAGLVDFAGHAGGGAYLPIWTFHDRAGTAYAEVLDVGYRVLQGQKPSVILMPVAVDLTSISGRLWDFQWGRDHVTRSVFPDIFMGPTPVLPIDHVQIKQLSIRRPQDWLALVGSVRFK